MEFSGERLAHPRRGRKPEFKLERCPPLDGAACCASWILVIVFGKFIVGRGLLQQIISPTIKV